MTGASLDLDIFKDIPGYKGILKAVLKYQIQLLVEQLCEHGGEESVLLSANVTEGTLSHLGSEAGKGFLIDNNDVKRQYLGYCLKSHQKRKSEFLSPPVSHGEVNPVRLVRSNPESVVSFPVHKKPYFRVQRRNTRLRSGGKQFSSFYSKSGLNRPTLQKIASHGTYLASGQDVSNSPYQGQMSNETLSRLESPRSCETLNQQYEGQRLEEQGQSSEVIVKTEIQTDDNNSNEESVTSQNEREITVKVEPPDDIDETGDKVSAVISEDIQSFGDGMGHQFSPNASMETEDSFSEGNQSFEYVLDQENSEDIITPWKPDETEKMLQMTSKRKQALPTRITKNAEQKCKDKNSSGLPSQSSQRYGDILSNQKRGNSEWFSQSQIKGNINQKPGVTGFTHSSSYQDRNQGMNSNQQTFRNRNTLQRGENVTENIPGRMQGSVWTQEQIVNMSPDKNAPYGEVSADRPGMSKGGDVNWTEEDFPPGAFKTYMKTPQIDGLFVSRGEGRYEKLIKCEDCGKVCRTSNMARHKKRYCTALPKGGRTRKSYVHTNEYPSGRDRPFDSSRSNIYLDNPEREGYNIDLTASDKDWNMSSVTETLKVDQNIGSKHLNIGVLKDKPKGKLISLLPKRKEKRQLDERLDSTDLWKNKLSADLTNSLEILNSDTETRTRNIDDHVSELQTDRNVTEMNVGTGNRAVFIQRTDETGNSDTNVDNESGVDCFPMDVSIKQEASNSDSI